MFDIMILSMRKSVVRLDFQAGVVSQSRFSSLTVGGLLVSPPSRMGAHIRWVYFPCEHQVFFEVQLQTEERVGDFVFYEIHPAFEAALQEMKKNA